MPQQLQLHTFRVQPHSFDRLVEASKTEQNRSAFIRRVLTRALEQPPRNYPARAVKADLTAFSVFLEPRQHDRLLRVARCQGVSKNLFLEATFNEL